jgi:hypothetical protein
MCFVILLGVDTGLGQTAGFDELGPHAAPFYGVVGEKLWKEKCCEGCCVPFQVRSKNWVLRGLVCVMMLQDYA